MSSAVRISVILVLLLATAALALIAMNLNAPKVAGANAAPGPTTVGYFVAARALPKGTLAREEDFAVRTTEPDKVPAGAILDTADSKAGLPGSLVRNFVEINKPITLQDILRPSDRGFLASVLQPDSRAISIKVDEESGVSGLIRPGDFVDVLLTQIFDKDEPSRRALSETVLSNVRVIAIDQEIAQGARQEIAQGTDKGKKTAAAPQPRVGGRVSQTVSLELAPEQVKRITVARQLGTLSLVIRSAVDQWNANAKDSGTVSSCDVSPELARQNAVAGQRTAIAVHVPGKSEQIMVRKQNADENDLRCDEGARAAAAGMAARSAGKR